MTCANDVLFTVFIYFVDEAQRAMTIHSVTLVLVKIEVLIQTLLGTRPSTLYSERTVAHTHMSV